MYRPFKNYSKKTGSPCLFLACEQALQGTLAAKGRRACNSISGIWIPPPIPLWLLFDWAVRFPPISAKWKRARMYTNIEKPLTRVMMSILISSPPITISLWLFWCRFSNSRDVVASCPSFPYPTARVFRRACSQASLFLACMPIILSYFY